MGVPSAVPTAIASLPGALLASLLEAARPMSLCVEFFATRNGNIRHGVGRLPMSRTGEARNAFHLVGIRDASDAQTEP
jgi:hypothetical protein